MEMDKNPVLQINFERLNFLLDLYGLSKEDFVSKLNEVSKTKKEYSVEEVFSSPEMKLSFLKKIDKVFNKGLTYYIDKSKPLKDKDTSIFFRKDKFETNLNFESKKKINQFEDKKFDIEIMLEDAEMELKRVLPSFFVNDDAKERAFEIREKFDEVKKELTLKKELNQEDSDRKILKNYMRVIEEFNIFVFEFKDGPNKKVLSNFNGFFMAPNLIVLKEQQYKNREIFTLVHELAHYLLNDEEIDENVDSSTPDSKIERWCNDFVFYFLIKDFLQDFESLEYANFENNFYEEEITEISKKTDLSKFALYTRLKMENKISDEDYNEMKNSITEYFRRIKEKSREEYQRKKFLAEQQGKKLPGGSVKPIESHLFVEVIKQNYFSGKMNETDICRYLNKPYHKVEEILYR